MSDSLEYVSQENEMQQDIEHSELNTEIALIVSEPFDEPYSPDVPVQNNFLYGTQCSADSNVPKSILRAEGLNKSFRKKQAVKDVSFSMAQGEVVGLLGPNGAGKTTVFKLLSGLLTPTMGKLQMFGIDNLSTPSDMLSQIGTLIETPIFYEHLSAAENLRMHLAYMGKEGGNVEDVLSKVGLKDIGVQPVSTFSLGMRQRLAIARAIIHKPQLLILDEPINGLDPMGIKEMRDLFLYLAKTEGMTLLISSHILTEIEHIADTIGVIVNGTIVREVSMDKVKVEYPSGLEEYFMDIMIGRKENENAD